MRLAEPIQAEIHFLFNVTNASDERAWLGGDVLWSLTNFRWFSEWTSPTNTILYHNGDLLIGLCFRRADTGTSGLTYDLINKLYFYLCSIP